MTVNLNQIKERDLIRESYQRILEIIEALEKVEPLRLSDVEAIETLETYLSFVYIIESRIENGEFQELESESSKQLKQTLQMRLKALREQLYFAMDLNVKLNRQLNRFYTLTNETAEQFEKEKSQIRKEVDMALQTIEGSEHDILSHVLSLMGIFSAIITIILSVIITSSSWINNANKADAVTAFTVPNLVALLAVSLLLSLIFLHNRHNSREKYQKRDILKSAVSYAIIGVALSATLLSSISLSLQTDIDTTPHVSYILSPGEYSVVPEVITPANPDAGVDEQKEYFYEFIFEDKLYRFEYDASYLRDGDLYFCEKHGTLE